MKNSPTFQYYFNRILFPFIVLLILLVSNKSVKAQFPLNESFMGMSASDFIFGGNPTAFLTDTGNFNGTLRLTANEFDQRGFAYYDGQSLLASQGINLEFEYFTYGGGNSGGDGITFFLFDASVNFQIGGFGGSLGYAQRFNEPGLRGAYLGIGFDEFGNFSNPNEGRQGGPGRVRNSVTLRGVGDGTNAAVPTNYPYLTSVDVFSTYGFRINSNSRTDDPNHPDYRKAFIRLTPRTGGGFFIDVDILRGGTGGGTLYSIVSNYEYPIIAPNAFKFGFAASTGAAKNFHEIRGLSAEINDGSTLQAPFANNDVRNGCRNFDVNNINFAANDITYGDPANTINRSTIDLDPGTPGQQLSFTDPGKGTFTYNSTTQRVDFVPEINFVGTAVAEYTVNDAFGTTSNVATITVNIFFNPGCSDVDIEKLISFSNPAVGDQVTFSLIAGNKGPSEASNVLVIDTLPLGYTFISHNGDTNVSVAGNVITWTIDTLDIDEYDTLNIIVEVLSVTDNEDYINTAKISSDDFDPDLSDNESEVNITDLEIVKTASDEFPGVGAQVQFTFEITNNGPNEATNVVVRDFLESGFRYCCDQGGAATTFINDTLTWNAGSLQVGESKTLLMTVEVRSSGNYTNTATVEDVSGKIIDFDISNNSSTIEVTPILRQPFTCNSTAFLLEADNNTNLFKVDLEDNVFTVENSLTTSANSKAIPGNITAAGYNIIDNFIWGYHEEEGKIVRISADNFVDVYNIIGFAANNYRAGDINSNGILHLYVPNSTSITRVDLNPSSSNYLRLITNLNTSPTNLLDFAFNPMDNNLYGVTNETSSMKLWRINGSSGNRTDLGDIGGQISIGDYTAAMIDANGTLLIGEPTLGEYWAIQDVSTDPKYASLVMDGMFSEECDGAFCSSSFFNMDIPSPLPVKWLSFEGEKVNEWVELTWRTASEINNDYFAIERSNDGINFHEIGRVMGAGNSNVILDYEFTDYEPLKGYSYYRLKQVDFDAAFEYSHIVPINFDNDNSNIKVFPNPFENNVTIDAGEKQIGYIRIHDVNGKVVFDELINKQISILMLNHLESGTYYISNEHGIISKLIKK